MHFNTGYESSKGKKKQILWPLLLIFKIWR